MDLTTFPNSNPINTTDRLTKSWVLPVVFLITAGIIVGVGVAVAIGIHNSVTDLEMIKYVVSWAFVGLLGSSLLSVVIVGLISRTFDSASLNLNVQNLYGTTY